MILKRHKNRTLYYQFLLNFHLLLLLLLLPMTKHKKLKISNHVEHLKMSGGRSNLNNVRKLLR